MCPVAIHASAGQRRKSSSEEIHTLSAPRRTVSRRVRARRWWLFTEPGSEYSAGMLSRAFGAVLATLVFSASAWAHHSFAVFFDGDKVAKVTGKVTEFKFANPHGTIALDVKGTVWKAETNAPVILRRLGWSKDSLHVGDTITIEGWMARDGKNYMRMRKVTRADGTTVGKPITFDPKSDLNSK